jgi:hypothetical protein
VAVLRTNASREIHFLSLAALSVLTLTPLYHRFYDTRLLLLTIPAVLTVYQKRRLLGALIAVLTALAIISVQYRVQMFLLERAEWQFVLPHKFLFVLLLRQQNLELLILFSLYLFAILSIRFTSPPPHFLPRSTGKSRVCAFVLRKGASGPPTPSSSTGNPGPAIEHDLAYPAAVAVHRMR